MSVFVPTARRDGQDFVSYSDKNQVPFRLRLKVRDADHGQKRQADKMRKALKNLEDRRKLQVAPSAEIWGREGLCGS